MYLGDDTEKRTTKGQKKAGRVQVILLSNSKKRTRVRRTGKNQNNQNIYSIVDVKKNQQKDSISRRKKAQKKG